MKTITIKEKKQRKLILLLPLIALPFLTFMFWKLGGGQAEANEGQNTDKNGFNLELPDAKIGDASPIDKMSYYDRAKEDTLRRIEAMNNDPSYQSAVVGEGTVDNGFGLNSSVYGQNNQNPSTTSQIDRRLYQLDQMYRGGNNQHQPNYSPSAKELGRSNDIDRLEQMMMSMQHSGGDPEMEQLTAMLDKINDLQNPQLAKEKLRKQQIAQRGRIFPVTSGGKHNEITLLDNDKGVSSNGFYSARTEESVQYQNAIQAVVHQSQTVITGSTVKLRLLNEVIIDGKTIPANTFVYGKASLQGERLQIEITSIRFLSSLYPVQLTVFDLDGIDGIRIPDAISRKVAKNGIDQGMQGVGLGSLDPSFAAQAAGTGIEVVKSFIGKKTKLIKVKLKAGYKILLRDDKQKNEPAELIKF